MVQTHPRHNLEAQPMSTELTAPANSAGWRSGMNRTFAVLTVIMMTIFELSAGGGYMKTVLSHNLGLVAQILIGLVLVANLIFAFKVAYATLHNKQVVVFKRSVLNIGGLRVGWLTVASIIALAELVITAIVAFN